MRIKLLVALMFLVACQDTHRATVILRYESKQTDYGAQLMKFTNSSDISTCAFGNTAIPCKFYDTAN